MTAIEIIILVITWTSLIIIKLHLLRLNKFINQLIDEWNLLSDEFEELQNKVQKLNDKRKF